MKITIVTYFYKPIGGGIPRYVDEIAQNFARLGNEVDIITFLNSDEKIEKEGLITVYRTPLMNVFLDKEKNIEKAKKFYYYMKNYLKKGTDIVIAQDLQNFHMGFGHILSLNLACIQKNIPLVLTAHSNLGEKEIKKLRVLLINNLFWEKIIVVSTAMADSYFKSGIDVKKLIVIYPPVNTDTFRPGLGREWLRSRINASEKDIIILHASRLDNPTVAEDKGIYTLLRAFSLISINNIKLLIAAAPTAKFSEKEKAKTIDKLMTSAKILKIDKKFSIQTFSAEEMPLVYNGADLFVMPSKYETFGLAYAEALACGIPAIGTSVGGIPEVIEKGRSGEIIQLDNPIELASKMEEMIENHTNRMNMGSYGRERVLSRQNADKIAKNLLGVYESIIQHKKSKDN